jgi:hypothetical protein
LVEVVSIPSLGLVDPVDLHHDLTDRRLACLHGANSDMDRLDTGFDNSVRRRLAANWRICEPFGPRRRYTSAGAAPLKRWKTYADMPAFATSEWTTISFSFADGRIITLVGPFDCDDGRAIREAVLGGLGIVTCSISQSPTSLRRSGWFDLAPRRMPYYAGLRRACLWSTIAGARRAIHRFSDREDVDAVNLRDVLIALSSHFSWCR